MVFFCFFKTFKKFIAQSFIHTNIRHRKFTKFAMHFFTDIYTGLTYFFIFPSTHLRAFTKASIQGVTSSAFLSAG